MVKTSINAVKLSIVVAAFALCACAPGEIEKNTAKIAKDPIDWSANLTKSEIRSTLRPERKEAETKNQLDDDSAIPPLQDVILAPDAPEMNSKKKISMTITEDIDLKDVLMELARLADLELALDSNISGGIILSVKNRDIGDVLDMVAEMADLKYTVEKGVLKVTRDHPYLVHYNVDYLNLVRSSSGSIDTSTSTGSSSGGGGGGGGSSGGSMNSGSSNSISTQQDGDLWASVENNIAAIIKSVPSSLKLAMSGQNAGSSGSADNNSSYTVNKQAGIISAYTTFRKHKSIQNYINQVMKNSSAQVLIEAKVIEVELNEAYATGIDWQGLANSNSVFSGAYNSNTTDFLSKKTLFGAIINASESSLTFKKETGAGSTEVRTILNFLEGFGVTRTLSNPRVTIMNNQQSVLTFAENQPYFTVEASAGTTGTANTAGTNNTFTTTLNTIPIGVIMSLQPSINVDTNEVTLHIRPTLTASSSTIKDPAIKLNNPDSDVESEIPVVQVRELDTVLKARSGDIMVIGGLIQHKDAASNKGAPFLQDIPIFGNLAKQTGRETKITETVILMKATIVPARSNYHEHDKKIYETFTQDPRPLVF